MRRRARTVVVGSSRVELIGARPGERRFANLSIPETSPDTLATFFKRLHRLQAGPLTVYSERSCSGSTATGSRRSPLFDSNPLSSLRDLLNGRTFKESLSVILQSPSSLIDSWRTYTVGRECVLDKTSRSPPEMATPRRLTERCGRAGRSPGCPEAPEQGLRDRARRLRRGRLSQLAPARPEARRRARSRPDAGRKLRLAGGRVLATVFDPLHHTTRDRTADRRRLARLRNEIPRVFARHGFPLLDLRKVSTCRAANASSIRATTAGIRTLSPRCGCVGISTRRPHGRIRAVDLPLGGRRSRRGRSDGRSGAPTVRRNRAARLGPRSRHDSEERSLPRTASRSDHPSLSAPSFPMPAGSSRDSVTNQVKKQRPLSHRVCEELARRGLALARRAHSAGRVPFDEVVSLSRLAAWADALDSWPRVQATRPVSIASPHLAAVLRGLDRDTYRLARRRWCSSTCRSERSSRRSSNSVAGSTVVLAASMASLHGEEGLPHVFSIEQEEAYLERTRRLLGLAGLTGHVRLAHPPLEQRRCSAGQPAATRWTTVFCPTFSRRHLICS